VSNHLPLVFRLLELPCSGYELSFQHQALLEAAAVGPLFRNLEHQLSWLC